MPVHWENTVKEHLDRDVRLGVLEKVPVGTPDTWCHRMVIVGKANGEPRRVVDFQPLNRHATRETSHEVSIPPGTQCPQGGEEERVRLVERIPLSANTPGGHALLYIYHTLGTVPLPDRPPGVGDGYTARFDSIIEDVPNKTKCVDDTLLWSSNIEQAFHDAADWLRRCGANEITLNPDKFVFAQDTVQFAGGPTTVKPACKLLHPCLPRMYDHGLGS